MPTYTWSWSASYNYDFNNQIQSGSQYGAQIAALTNGTFLATWDPGNLNSVQGRIDSVAGLGTSEFFVNSTTRSYQYDASVAGLKGGNAVVSFTDTSSSSNDIRARIIRPDGTATGLDFAVDDGAAEEYDSSVAALKDGGFIVSWTRQYSSTNDYDTLARVFNADGTVRTNIISVDTASDRDTYESHVTSLASGGYVISFVDSSGGIYFQRYDAGSNPIGVQVNVVSSGASQSIAALNDGGFAIAFQDTSWSGGDNYDITLRLYNADGSARGSSILVNVDATAGSQLRPSIAVLPNGLVVVGWDSGGYTYRQAFDSFGAKLGENAIGTRGTDIDLASVATGSVIGVHTIPDAPFEDKDGSSIAKSVFDLVRITTGDGSSETLTGDLLVDFINGGGGSDVIYGLAGNDDLSGDAGDDKLYGGAGEDRIIGGQGNDTLDGQAGVDYMVGGTENDTYFVDDTADQVYELANEGNDTIYASVSYSLTEGSEVEILRALAPAATAALYFIGNGLAQNIIGNAGANSLDGKAGADIMQGLGGDDIYYVDNAGDVVIEAVGNGNDRIIASATYAMQSGREIERIDAAAGTAPINLTGNEFVQNLIGNAGNNIINGGGGADMMQGLAGNDTFYVDNVGDIVIEAAGNGNDSIVTSVNYTIQSGREIERMDAISGTSAINLTGNEFSQSLIGNAGANVINGGAGNDTISGGLGNDILSGGIGNDTFRFLTGYGRDTVTDFAGGTGIIDRIDLRDSGFANFAAVQAAAVQVGANLEIHVGANDVLVLQNFSKSNFAMDDLIV